MHPLKLPAGLVSGIAMLNTLETFERGAFLVLVQEGRSRVYLVSREELGYPYFTTESAALEAAAVIRELNPGVVTRIVETKVRP